MSESARMNNDVVCKRSLFVGWIITWLRVRNITRRSGKK